MEFIVFDDAAIVYVKYCADTILYKKWKDFKKKKRLKAWLILFNPVFV